MSKTANPSLKQALAKDYSPIVRGTQSDFKSHTTIFKSAIDKAKFKTIAASGERSSATNIFSNIVSSLES